jgi:hypothetical protein
MATITDMNKEIAEIIDINKLIFLDTAQEEDAIAQPRFPDSIFQSWTIVSIPGKQQDEVSVIAEMPHTVNEPVITLVLGSFNDSTQRKNVAILSPNRNPVSCKEIIPTSRRLKTLCIDAVPYHTYPIFRKTVLFDYIACGEITIRHDK